MDILGITEPRFFAFLLILLRMGSLFAFAPVFSNRIIPVQVKVASVLGLSVCLASLGVVREVPVPRTASLLALLAAQEVFLGILTGFVAQLVFAAVQFGGQLVGFDMGLGIVSILDPQLETQISVISEFQFLLASVIFLGVGGDRMLLEVFARNFQEIPPGQLVVAAPAVRMLVRLSGEVFRVGLQTAAPVIVALFASNVVLGVFARAVPQMNMLILGFPLKIIVGFVVLGLSLPHWSEVFLRAVAESLDALKALPAVLR